MPRQPQLASWICSIRAVAFALEFQANDGSEEEPLKNPLEAAVRIEASWLLNGLMASKSFVHCILGSLPWSVAARIHSGTNTLQPQR